MWPLICWPDPTPAWRPFSAPAPRLATIEWYKEHNDGKLTVNDGLLSATVPSVIDTWYVLLDRWGTKTFAEVLQPAIEVAEQGFELIEALGFHGTFLHDCVGKPIIISRRPPPEVSRHP